MTTNILFGAFPYAALAVLVVGLAARCLSTSSRGADIELAEAWALFSGGKIWRAGFSALALLHVGGLILPRAILAWNGVPLRLYVLEGTGFAFGLFALGWWVGVTRRHLWRSSDASLSELADGVFLSLVFVGITSGLLTAILYRWGSSWGAATLSPYGSSLLRAAPLVSFVDQMPLLVQLHVVSLFALMMVFPFTRAACFATFVVQRAVGLLAAPLSAASSGARAWLDQHHPASLIWPEEEYRDDHAVARAVVTDGSADGERGPRSPATLPPPSGIRETRGYSLEADAELEKTGSDMG